MGSWGTSKAISFCLLITSLVLVILSVKRLSKDGGATSRANTPENFSFENTAQLVTSGVYKYIRHPMYSSLILLNWGIMLQQPTWLSLSVAMMVSFMLIITIRVEETENIAYFGNDYLNYQRQSKMLIPFML
jgi:protein-S-isoprenylcysteine O-methyltransferase Ste14